MSALFALFVAGSSPAAIETWGNTSTDFNTGGSWLSGTAPTTSGTALFAGLATAQPQLTNSLSIGRLQFEVTGTNYNVSSSGPGVKLTLTGATAISNSNTTSVNTVSAGIILGASSGTQTFTQINPGQLVVSGNIEEIGTRGLILAGSGGVTYTLSGSNSYSGGTFITNSIVVLNITNAASIGTGALTLGSISGMTLNNTSGTAVTLSNALILNNNSAGSSSANNFIFTGSSSMTITGPIAFNGFDKSLRVDNNALTLTGAISEDAGSRALFKNGAGTLILSNSANAYSGSTFITSGVLEVSTLANGGANSSMGTSSNAATNLLISNSSTLRYTGTGASTDRLLTITNGTAGSFVESSGSGALVFTNTGAIAQGGNVANTRVMGLGGSNTGDNTFAPVIGNATGATGLIKSGSGTWILTGVNTYTNPTMVSGGILQAVDGVSLPSASILQLRGGVFQSSGTFSRQVTTASGGVNWSSSSGGFAARGGVLALQLNGGTASVTWNGNSFVQDARTLILGSTRADNLVDFQNGLSLGTTGTNTRTVTAVDNPSSTTDRSRISGVITGIATQTFQKDGNGLLELTAVNTYSGTTVVSAGTLMVSGVGTINSSASVQVAGGARFVYSNTATAISRPIALAGSGTSSRAVLGGKGTIATSVVLDNVGDTLSPGESPGVLSFNAVQDWDAFSYDWELNNFADNTSAGTAFDQIQITGGLDLTDGTTGSYLLNVISLTAGNVTGLVPNFSETTKSWVILAATGGITGFSASDWIINSSAFLSSPSALGTWSIGINDTLGTDSLVLTYSIPEPSTCLLLGLGAAGVLFGFRRRRA